jgi:MarR family
VAREQDWLRRVRAGLEALLAYLDAEPQWSRVLLCDPPVAESLAAECRQRLQGVLGEVVDQGLAEGNQGLSEGLADDQAHALRGELVAGGVFSVIRTRLSAGEARPLVDLAPSLTSFIAACYRADAGAVGAGERKPAGNPAIAWRGSELPIRATRRTLLVLRAIAAAPRLSNREIAEAGGLSDEGQTSRLLGRLERHGLIENVGRGQAWGESNAWLLTPAGEHVAKLISDGFAAGAPGQRGKRVRGAA